VGVLWGVSDVVVGIGATGAVLCTCGWEQAVIPKVSIIARYDFMFCLCITIFYTSFSEDISAVSGNIFQEIK
jgi:hypothetical protein